MNVGLGMEEGFVAFASAYFDTCPLRQTLQRLLFALTQHFPMAFRSAAMSQDSLQGLRTIGAILNSPLHRGLTIFDGIAMQEG